MPHRKPFRVPAGSTVFTVVVTGYYVLLDSGSEEATDGRSRSQGSGMELIAMLFLLPSAYQLFSLKNILDKAAEDANFTEPHLRTTSNISCDVWKMHLQSTSFEQQSTMMTHQGVALVSTG